VCSEPANDSPSGACGPLASGWSYQGYVDSPQDQFDWYYFDMARPGAIDVWLTSIPQGCVLDIEVFDSSLQRIAHETGVGNADMYLHATGSSQGRYYVRLTRIQGSSTTQAYTLQVEYGMQLYETPRIWLPLVLQRRSSVGSAPSGEAMPTRTPLPK